VSAARFKVNPEVFRLAFPADPDGSTLENPQLLSEQRNMELVIPNMGLEQRIMELEQPNMGPERRIWSWNNRT
jgi:hypothetical protein